MGESDSNNTAPATVVIIPAYNEGPILVEVAEALLQKKYTLIIVDDGSSPSLQHQLDHLPIYYLRHKANLGQGAALQTGFDFALKLHPQFIVSFDGDGQHQVQDIIYLLNPLQKEKADITLGSRFLSPTPSNVPIAKKIVLMVARFINFLFTGLFLSDAHNGLRAFTFSTLQKIRISENRMAHASELLFEIKKNKLRYIEVPVTIHYTEYARQKGQSTWQGLQIIFDLVLHKLFK